MTGIEWVGPPLDNLHPTDVLHRWPCDLGELMNVFIVLAEYRSLFGAWPSRLWIPKAKADVLQTELTWSGWSALTTKLKVKVSASVLTLSCSGDEGVAFYGCVDDGPSDYELGEAAEWLYGLQAWLLWEEPEVEDVAPIATSQGSPLQVQPLARLTPRDVLRQRQYGLSSGTRLLVSVAEFRARYGRWPTRLTFPQDFIAVMRDEKFTPAAWDILTSRVAVDAGRHSVASDEAGHAVEYLDESLTDNERAVASALLPDAAEWLLGCRSILSWPEVYPG